MAEDANEVMTVLMKLYWVTGCEGLVCCRRWREWALISHMAGCLM